MTPDRAPAADSTTLRVPVEKVDQLINLVGELVITQAALEQNAEGLDHVRHQRMAAGMAELERNTRALQEAVMSIRMIPMSMVFNRFPRMLRDLAQKLGKSVELVTQGEATELDKGMVEKITDPLTHLVRNACDHGIELPADRIAAGKPVGGTITLAASHQGGSIVIEVRDDGRRVDDLPDAVHQILALDRTTAFALVMRHQCAQGVVGGQQHVDHRRGGHEFLAAQLVEQRLHLVRQFGHIHETEGGRAALDRVGAAEDGVQFLGVVGPDVQRQELLLELLHVLAGLFEEDGRELAQVECVVVCIIHGSGSVSCADWP